LAHPPHPTPRSLRGRLARDGAKIAIAAKTSEPHPKLPGTIFSAAEEIRAAGGECLPLQVDIRDADAVQKAVDAAAKEFGGLDIVVNNASAIDNSSTLDVAVKKVDLMLSVNGRGTFVTTKACLPYLLQSANPHVLMISPPLNMDPRWFKLGGTAYTIAKYNMSMCALGFAEEFAGKVSVNALWPRTAIATAAIEMIGGSLAMRASRKPEIVADAAHWILTRKLADRVSGNFFIDDEILRAKLGLTQAQVDAYNMTPGVPPLADFFLGDPEEAAKLVEMGRKVQKATKAVGDFFKKFT
jgi:citronellol/citronellal dehydrogenase